MTSFADADFRPEPEDQPDPAEPFGPADRYPTSPGCGPAGLQVRRIVEANERRGATTTTGYTGPSGTRRQTTAARTRSRKPDRARHHYRRSSAVRRYLSSM